ncbi:hypothetical protein [Xanthomonas sp. BRIP62409]|uniref:hypothetical protein n=1 Tax=Xanthomonas sp. BRIP62409 TaxID=2182388 RepID=UPI000F8F0A43|nr:hypothetical protein [Xanthomonas sp. BRIP62409]
MATRTLATKFSVPDYINNLAKPLQSEVQQLRVVILGVAVGIGEEMKWNASSFFLGEHFATIRLRGKVPSQLILHLGAKKGASIPKAAQSLILRAFLSGWHRIVHALISPSIPQWLREQGISMTSRSSG